MHTAMMQTVVVKMIAINRSVAPQPPSAVRTVFQSP
jgi:hypothetical protein